MNKAKAGASFLKDKIEDLDQICMEYGKKIGRKYKGNTGNHEETNLSDCKNRWQRRSLSQSGID